MDDTYQTYLNRVARQMLPATYQSQLQFIQESPKFKRLQDGSREAAPFPGYTVVTPPWEEEAENGEFYKGLEILQQRLLEQLEPNFLVPVPPASFHLTLADLIWESAYEERRAENPEYDRQLLATVADSFQQYRRSATESKPIRWQLLGLMVMPRAMGVCLAPTDEESYRRVLHLRRALYQNRPLIGLGVQQQYHFTAHITLGYFGEIPEHLDRDRLSRGLAELNQRSPVEDAPPFWVRRAELRKFDDMMHYDREPDWPAISL